MRKRKWRLALLGATTFATAGACNLVVNLPPEGPAQSDSGPSMPGLEGGSSETGTEAGVDAGPSDSGRADSTTEAAPADAATEADAGIPTTIIALAGTPPVSLAVDGTNVYWTEINGGVFKVSRDADGGPVTTLKAPDNVDASAGRIATDGTHVYWVDTAHRAIQYVSVLGGTPTPLVSPTNPGGVATDGAYVYWSDLDANGVYRVAIVDAGTIQNMNGNLSAVNVYAIAVTASWLAWAELEGSRATENVSGYTYAVALTPEAGVASRFTKNEEWNRNVWFIAVDDKAVYSTAAGDVPGTAGVGLLPLPPPQEGIGLASDTTPGAVALSSTHDIFWVDQALDAGLLGWVRWVRYDADASPVGTWQLPAATVTSAANPVAIGVDHDAVYWANAGAPYAIEKVRLADLPR
jgi:hypothetical protein